MTNRWTWHQDKWLNEWAWSSCGRQAIILKLAAQAQLSVWINKKRISLSLSLSLSKYTQLAEVHESLDIGHGSSYIPGASGMHHGIEKPKYPTMSREQTPSLVQNSEIQQCMLQIGNAEINGKKVHVQENSERVRGIFFDDMKAGHAHLTKWWSRHSSIAKPYTGWSISKKIPLNMGSTLYTYAEIL